MGRTSMDSADYRWRYRGSTGAGVRALAAAGIAAGVAMLAIVALTVPVTRETSTSGTQDPVQGSGVVTTESALD